MEIRLIGIKVARRDTYSELIVIQGFEKEDDVDFLWSTVAFPDDVWKSFAQLFQVVRVFLESLERGLIRLSHSVEDLEGEFPPLGLVGASKGRAEENHSLDSLRHSLYPIATGASFAENYRLGANQATETMSYKDYRTRALDIVSVNNRLNAMAAAMAVTSHTVSGEDLCSWSKEQRLRASLLRLP